MAYSGKFSPLLAPRVIARANRSFNEGRQPALSVLPTTIADLVLVYSSDDPFLMGRYEKPGTVKSYDKDGVPQHTHYLLNYNVVEKLWEVEDGKQNLKFPNIDAAVSHIKAQR